MGEAVDDWDDAINAEAARQNYIARFCALRTAAYELAKAFGQEHAAIALDRVRSDLPTIMNAKRLATDASARQASPTA